MPKLSDLRKKLDGTFGPSESGASKSTSTKPMGRIKSLQAKLDATFAAPEPKKPITPAKNPLDLGLPTSYGTSNSTKEIVWPDTYGPSRNLADIPTTLSGSRGAPYKQPTPAEKPKSIGQQISETEDTRMLMTEQKRTNERLKGEGLEPDRLTNPEKYVVDYEKPGVLGQFSRGIQSSYFSTIQKGAGAFLQSLGAGSSDKIVKLGQRISDQAVAHLAKNPELLIRDEDASAAESLANTMGQMIPYVATVMAATMTGTLAGGVAAGGVTATAAGATALATQAGTIAGFGTLYAIEKGNILNRYREEGVAPDKAELAASVYAGLAAAVENISGFKPGQFAGTVAGPGLQATIKRTFKEFIRIELPKFSTKILKTALGEAGEEGIQNFLENLMVKFFKEDTSLWAGTKESLIGGFAGGLAFGGVEVAIPALKGRVKTGAKGAGIVPTGPDGPSGPSGPSGTAGLAPATEEKPEPIKTETSAEAETPTTTETPEETIPDRTIVDGKVTTTSGRKIPAPPALVGGSDKKAAGQLKAIDNWLVVQAREEAIAKNDEYNLKFFENLNAAKLTPAERSALNVYLFGEQYPEFTAEETAAKSKTKTTKKPTALVGATNEVENVRKKLDYVSTRPYVVESPDGAVSAISNATGKTFFEVMNEYGVLYSENKALVGGVELSYPPEVAKKLMSDAKKYLATSKGPVTKTETEKQPGLVTKKTATTPVKHTQTMIRRSGLTDELNLVKTPNWYGTTFWIVRGTPSPAFDAIVEKKAMTPRMSEDTAINEVLKNLENKNYVPVAKIEAGKHKDVFAENGDSYLINGSVVVAKNVFDVVKAANPDAKISVDSPNDPVRFTKNGKVVGLAMPSRAEAERFTAEGAVEVTPEKPSGLVAKKKAKVRVEPKPMGKNYVGTTFIKDGKKFHVDYFNELHPDAKKEDHFLGGAEGDDKAYGFTASEIKAALEKGETEVKKKPAGIVSNKKAKPPVSDAQRAKLLGNSLVTGVVEKIGSTLLEEIEKADRVEESDIATTPKTRAAAERTFKDLKNSNFKVRLKETGTVVFADETIAGPEDVAFAFRGLTNEAVESFYSVAVKNNRVVGVELVSMGTLNASLVHPREIVELMKAKGADSMYVVHNHPSGSVAPSIGDLDLTRRLEAVGKTIDVELKGHIIIDTVKFGFINPGGGGDEEIFHLGAAKNPTEVSVYKKYVEWASEKPKDFELTNANSVFEIIKGLRLNRGNSIVSIYVNTRNHVISVEATPRARFDLKEIAVRAARLRSASVVFGGVDLKSVKGLGDAEEMFTVMGIEVLDYVNIAGGLAEALSLSDLNKTDKGNPRDVYYSMGLLGDGQVRDAAVEKELVDKARGKTFEEFVAPLTISYHGSPHQFEKFDYSKMGERGTTEGKGFYFADNREVAEHYFETGGQLVEAFIDIRKPLSSTEKKITPAQLRKFLKALDKNDRANSDGENIGYLDNWGDISHEGYEAVLNKAVNGEYNGSENDVDMISGIINASGNYPQDVYPTLKKTLGYDGIITQPNWDKGQTIRIAFDPGQIYTTRALKEIWRRANGFPAQFKLDDNRWATTVKNWDLMLEQFGDRAITESDINSFYNKHTATKMERLIVDTVLKEYGKTKIPAKELVASLKMRTMRLTLINSRSWAEYGVSNITRPAISEAVSAMKQGRPTWDISGLIRNGVPATHIWNTPVNHGYYGHFSGDFSGDVDYEIRPLRGLLNGEMIDKFAVVVKDALLTEQNLQENVANVFDKEADAIAWIEKKKSEGPTGRNVGLLGHSRILRLPSPDPDGGFSTEPNGIVLTEVQSDAFQNFQFVRLDYAQANVYLDELKLLYDFFNKGGFSGRSADVGKKRNELVEALFRLRNNHRADSDYIFNGLPFSLDEDKTPGDVITLLNFTKNHDLASIEPERDYKDVGYLLRARLKDKITDQKAAVKTAYEKMDLLEKQFFALGDKFHERVIQEEVRAAAWEAGKGGIDFYLPTPLTNSVIEGHIYSNNVQFVSGRVLPLKLDAPKLHTITKFDRERQLSQMLHIDYVGKKEFEDHGVDFKNLREDDVFAVGNRYYRITQINDDRVYVSEEEDVIGFLLPSGDEVKNAESIEIGDAIVDRESGKELRVAFLEANKIYAADPTAIEEFDFYDKVEESIRYDQNEAVAELESLVGKYGDLTNIEAFKKAFETENFKSDQKDRWDDEYLDIDAFEFDFNSRLAFQAFYSIWEDRAYLAKNRVDIRSYVEKLEPDYEFFSEMVSDDIQNSDYYERYWTTGYANNKVIAIKEGHGGVYEYSDRDWVPTGIKLPASSFSSTEDDNYDAELDKLEKEHNELMKKFEAENKDILQEIDKMVRDIPQENERGEYYVDYKNILEPRHATVHRYYHEQVVPYGLKYLKSLGVETKLLTDETTGLQYWRGRLYKEQRGAIEALKLEGALGETYEQATLAEAADRAEKNLATRWPYAPFVSAPKENTAAAWTRLIGEIRSGKVNGATEKTLALVEDFVRNVPSETLENLTIRGALKTELAPSVARYEPGGSDIGAGGMISLMTDPTRQWTFRDFAHEYAHHFYTYYLSADERATISKAWAIAKKDDLLMAELFGRGDHNRALEVLNEYGAYGESADTLKQEFFARLAERHFDQAVQDRIARTSERGLKGLWQKLARILNRMFRHGFKVSSSVRASGRTINPSLQAIFDKIYQPGFTVLPNGLIKPSGEMLRLDADLTAAEPLISGPMAKIEKDVVYRGGELREAGGGEQDFGQGFYFAEKLSTAKQYGGGEARAYRVVLNNPLRVKDRYEMNDVWDEFIVSKPDEKTTLRDWLRSKGYDGIIVENGGMGDERGVGGFRVAFDRSQISDYVPTKEGAKNEPVVIGKFPNGVPIMAAEMGRIAPIELPELVEMAKELVPRVGMNLTGGRALGMFRGYGGIDLRPSIFSDTKLAAEVLAHEIGHAIDWYPEKLGMDRGNLLGRIFTLRRFMENTFGESTVTNKEYREELLAVVNKWSPIPENAPESFLKYRKSAKELYADTLSILLNSPGFLEQEAPKFYNAFFKNLEKKFDVMTAYFALQDRIHGGEGEVRGFRRERVKEMFKAADYRAVDLEKIRRADAEKRRKDLLFRWKRDIMTIHAPFEQRVSEKPPTNPDDNPVYLLNGLNYVGAKVHAYFTKNIQPIYDALNARKLDWNLLGEVLFYERIAKGDRKRIANPGGFQPEFAEDMYNEPKIEADNVTEGKANMNSLRDEVGDENFKFLQEQAVILRGHLKALFEQGYKAGLYTDDLMKLVRENEYYVPFKTQKYMDQKQKFTVRRQVGTLSDIENPANTAMNKIISIIKAIEYNNAKVSAIDYLKEAFPSDIEDARMVFSGKARVPVKSIDPAKKLVIYYKDGKVNGVYVDEYIADSLEQNTVGQTMAIVHTLRLLNGRWFRPVFTTFNLGFQATNAIRDFHRFWRNVPGLSLPRALKRYAQAIAPAYRRGFNVTDELITSLEEKQVLGVTYNDTIQGESQLDRQIEVILEGVGLGEVRAKHNIIYRSLQKTLNFIGNLADTIESIPKIAAYFELKDRMPERQMADFIRRKTGSPDFTAKGKYTPATNNIFLFSNAIIQGIRSDYEVATSPETRSGFWWKTVQANFIPKILMYMALRGLFGEWLKEILSGATEYDRTNYNLLPIGVDQNGKSIYFRVPTDETGRLLGAIFWKIINAPTNEQGIGKDLSNIAALWGGQLPSLSPALTVPRDILKFVQGENIYDDFRQRNVLTDDQLAAGGLIALKSFARYEFQNLGGNIFVKFHTGDQSNKTKLERVLAFPLVSGIIGRFIRVSDYGKTESLKKIGAEVEKKDAKRRIETGEVIKRYAQLAGQPTGLVSNRKKIERDMLVEIFGHLPETPEEKAEATRLKTRLTLAIKKTVSDAYARELLYAPSNSAKIAILTEIQKNISPEKFQELKVLLRESNIVSKEVLKGF